MAKYINLDVLMEYCQNQKDKTISCNDLARFNTADVIERFKIDKAIKDINYEIKRDVWNSSFECGLQEALEILKRNIGE